MTKRIKFFCWLLILITSQAMAKITVNISPASIRVEDEFTLSFLYEGQTDHVFPDFSPLSKHFSILGTAKSSQISIVNGQVSAQTQWQVTLNAKKAGTYTIPPIAFGKENSPSKEITVHQASTPMDPSGDKKIFMEGSVNQTSPYVQQQIIYRVKMFYQEQPSYGKFNPPQADNALLTELGDSRKYTTQLKGKDYYVVEQDYAVFPEKTGSLIIHSPVFIGNLRRDNLADIDQIMMGLHQRIKVAAPDVTVQVQPIPATYQASTWLPAKQLTLAESWQDLTQTPTVGKPLTRIITIKATGLMSSQLPNLSFDAIPGAGAYAQAPVTKDTLVGNDIVGQKTYTITYIPSGDGNVEIPAITIPWWDISANKIQQAELKAKTIAIPTVTKKTPPASNQRANLSASKEHSPDTQAATAESQRTVLPAKQSDSYLQWLLLALLLASWLYFFYSRHFGKSGAPEGAETEQTEKQFKFTKSDLKQACLNNTAIQAQQQLLAWAKTRWPKSVIRQLRDVKHHVETPELREQIVALEKALYGSSPNWDGQLLWQTWLTHQPKQSKNKPKANDTLPKFNP